MIFDKSDKKIDMEKQVEYTTSKKQAIFYDDKSIKRKDILDFMESKGYYITATGNNFYVFYKYK